VQIDRAAERTCKRDHDERGREEADEDGDG
jgi:hypothetical protein